MCVLCVQEHMSCTFKLDCPLFPFRAFVRPLQERGIVNSKYNSPFLTCLDFGVCAPQSASFALATTHSLDVLLNASRPYHRSPSACLEGTHGDRVAGDNTQHSHRLLSFSFYVTRSRTKRIQTRPLTCTIHQARRSLFSPPLRLVFRLRISTLRI